MSRTLSESLIIEGIKALREQRSFMDRVKNSVANRVNSVGNLANRVTGRNSTQLKNPTTFKDILNRKGFNGGGGYTSKDNMFNYDEHGDVTYAELDKGIGPTSYYSSRGGLAYGGNDRTDGRGNDDSPYERGITTRSFSRGEFNTITGTGRSREGDAAREVNRRSKRRAK